jgi:nucleoside-diphosphate-sugar epimerase
MYKILLTGSTGFIGKFLIKQLLKDGNQIIEFKDYKGDISDARVWDNIPKVDIVIHAAALTSVPDSWESSYDFFKTNFLGTICALEYCKKYNSRLIFLSSYLYGNQEILPINEDAELKCSNPYALSKKIAEDTCKFYSESFNISVSVIRPFNIFGPGQNDKFLIPQLINQIIEGKEINVNDLNPKRDYIYIYDLVDLISKVIKKEYSYIVVNAGSGISYSVNEIISKIQKSLGTNLHVNSSNQYRKSEINETVADITRAYKYFKWIPQWTFDLGINDIIKDLALQGSY